MLAPFGVTQEGPFFSALTPGYSRDTQEASGTRGDGDPAAISLAIVGYQRTVTGAGGIYSRHFDKM